MIKTFLILKFSEKQKKTTPDILKAMDFS